MIFLFYVKSRWFLLNYRSGGQKSRSNSFFCRSYIYPKDFLWGNHSTLETKQSCILSSWEKFGPFQHNYILFCKSGQSQSYLKRLKSKLWRWILISSVSKNVIFFFFFLQYMCTTLNASMCTYFGYVLKRYFLCARTHCKCLIGHCS